MLKRQSTGLWSLHVRSHSSPSLTPFHRWPWYFRYHSLKPNELMSIVEFWGTGHQGEQCLWGKGWLWEFWSHTQEANFPPRYFYALDANSIFLKAQDSEGGWVDGEEHTLKWIGIPESPGRLTWWTSTPALSHHHIHWFWCTVPWRWVSEPSGVLEADIHWDLASELRILSTFNFFSTSIRKECLKGLLISLD